MATWRWKLKDTSSNEQYTLHVNPHEGGTPRRTKSLEYQHPVGQGGSMIVFQGPDSALEATVSGVILSEDHLNALQSWFDRDRILELTDDLNRRYSIILSSFEPQRVRSNNFWRHNYTLTYIVLEELN